jgi:hypothetical protein
MKGRIPFCPMDMIMIVLVELEYLEGLVKLRRKKKNETSQA